MKKIAVVGSLNMDLVTRVKNMPKLGETILGQHYQEIPGGKGANQAVAIARLGGMVSMIGRVGADGFGTALLKSLKQDGVLVDGVKIDEGISTGIAVILVEDSGNNSIVVVPGANFKLEVASLKEPEPLWRFTEAELVLLQLEVPLETVAYALKAAKEQQKYTILNPAPALPLDQELFRYVDLLLPNETELETLTGINCRSQENLVAASRSLLDQGVKEVIVTLGEKGCLHVTDQLADFYPAYQVRAVDTTAAGDSFAGGLAVALAEGKTMKESIGFAMKVGALTVMKPGAQSSLPTRSQVEAFKGGL